MSPSYTLSQAVPVSPAGRDTQDPSNSDVNSVGSLQEMCMKNNWTQPSYDLVCETGESHMKTFIYQCKVLIQVYIKYNKQLDIYTFMHPWVHSFLPPFLSLSIHPSYSRSFLKQKKGSCQSCSCVFQVESWIAQGQGRNKKTAKKLAAENLISMIREAAKVSAGSYIAL